MRTGLGFGLWVDGGDEAADKSPAEDLTSHSIWAIKERMQIAYTNAIKKGMSTHDIAEAVGMSEDMVRVVFTYFDQLAEFEKRLGTL
jgi:hypothetical protein